MKLKKKGFGYLQLLGILKIMSTILKIMKIMKIMKNSNVVYLLLTK